MTFVSGRRGLPFLLLLAVPGCPDDPVVSGNDDSGSTTAASGDTSADTSGAACVPGETQSCPCPDGPGMQTCEPDGSGFSPCECAGDTLDTTSTSGASTGVDTTGGDTTGPVPCVSDDECTDVASGECMVGICGEDGMCTEGPAPFDTPCGDATADECTAPDTCNNSGVCQSHDVADGLGCSTCPSGQCTCTAGACGECNVFAPNNNFITTRSIDGWTFTGSWGLHRQTPSSEVAIQSRFPGQVLGSDGNRVAPFPGNEIETSYARTPPVTLPATIAFLSWHVDEGGGASDNKTVRASTDGGMTWQTLADCAVDPGFVFCQPQMDADPAIWFLAEVPVPGPLQGQTAIVEFGYDTVDACCDFEKGWYIDALNIATECACGDDADCAAYSDTCGTGYCAPSGECALIPMPDDTACGDPADSDCDGADTCDGAGYCDDHLGANGLSLCGDCPGGAGCSFCDAGQCLDCMSFTDFSDFSDPLGVAGWQITGLSGTPDWGLYDEAPPNQNVGSLPVPFPNAPVYGTDGNRNPPYPGSESEHSQVVTSVGVVPTTVTFISWNVDEGDFFDTKKIDISVDGGMTWSNLVDCQVANTQPFCNFVADGRLGTDWDMISLDTSMWQGQAGQLRFTYDTGDSCCGFERGWYIDDLSFASFCNDQPFGP